MGKPATNVTLDDDVEAALHKLADRSGRPIAALANTALRDYLRYENEVASSIERGLADLDAGRTQTTAELIAYLQDQRRARRA